MKLSYFLIIVTVLFLFFVEKNVGNVFIRPGSDNLRHFRFLNIFTYMIEPLHNTFLWNISLLPYNYIFVVVLSTIIHTNLIQNKFEDI